MNLKKVLLFVVVLIISITLGFSSVNKSISVDSGKETDDSLSSVNGSISIGDNVVVNGSLTNVNGSIRTGEKCKVENVIRNVNGSIRLGDNSSATKISSVNGSIRVGKNVSIREIIKSVNGSIKCETGTKIKREIDTVNGSITLYGTDIGEGITTYNGHIKLKEKSIVNGDIVIKKSKGNFINRIFGKKRKELRIRLSGNSVVKGDIINMNEDKDVVLELDEGCRVEGKLINITKEK
ncbi:MAG: hypothetical protein KAI29_01605 [Cyclobacteriaceae bacterium]|nr:hypothetical protein [Cyclobacteriaceae bacterium]